MTESRSSRHLLVLCVFAVFFLKALPIHGQIIYNPNDERFRQLAFEKALWTLKDVRQQYVRDQQLWDRKLISADDLFSTESRYRIAEIELQQALLALAQETPHLAVERAVLLKDQRGRAIIEVKLRNLSQLPGSRSLDTLLSDIDGHQSLSELLVLRSVFVSLKNENTIIALPYEQRIDSLAPGESRVLTYQLLKNVERIEVVAQFAGKIESKNVLVQRGSDHSDLQLSANPMAQEAEYGSIAEFRLRLDRGKDFIDPVELMVEGLPESFQASFIDISSGARVAKVTFPPAGTTLDLRLDIQLPSRMQLGGLADSTLRYDVQAISSLDGRLVGEIELELVPVGRGEIVLRSRNWRYTERLGEPISLPIEVSNTGSVSMRDVRWDIHAPSGWSAVPAPDNITELGPDEMTAAKIMVQAPSDELVGEFEVDVRVFCFQDGKRVESALKTFRIELKSSTSTTTITILTVLAAGFLAVMIWLIRKLGRR